MPASCKQGFRLVQLEFVSTSFAYQFNADVCILLILRLYADSVDIVVPLCIDLASRVVLKLSRSGGNCKHKVRRCDVGTIEIS